MVARVGKFNSKLIFNMRALEYSIICAKRVDFLFSEN